MITDDETLESNSENIWEVFRLQNAPNQLRQSFIQFQFICLPIIRRLSLVMMSISQEILLSLLPWSNSERVFNR